MPRIPGTRRLFPGGSLRKHRGIVQGEIRTQRLQCLPGGGHVLLSLRPTVMQSDLATGEQGLGILETGSLAIGYGKALV